MVGIFRACTTCTSNGFFTQEAPGINFFPFSSKFQIQNVTDTTLNSFQNLQEKLQIGDRKKQSEGSFLF